MSVNNNLNQLALSPIRRNVMETNQILQNLIPPTVSYSTEGNLLIIGAEDLARLAADKLLHMSNLVILATDPITDQDENHLEKVMNSAVNVECFYNKMVSIKGFLGQFQVIVNKDELENDNNSYVELSAAAIRKPHFDIILDLSLTPCLNLEMPPPGYFYVGQDLIKLNDALEQIPELIGEFEKPRYVKINADLCAHHRSGIDGCNRCLNFCPADAVKSINNKIEVDPYLCHGAGSCSSACPTGAISYDLPTPQSLHHYLHKLVTQYIEQTDIAPVILFHDASSAHQITDELAADVLPIELEETTVSAIDHWMSSLAWGARQVVILNSPATAPTLTQMLQGEIQLANEILNEIALPQRIQLIDDLASITPLIDTSRNWPKLEANEFIKKTKRNTFFDAIDHLNSQSANIQSSLAIANVPYGLVSINQDNCTLCLSCAAICPTQALNDGGDKPALTFTEQNCVQCGLCESACPEKIVSLTPQINFDRETRHSALALKEEIPFECIVCGVPFATQSMVSNMLNKIGEHSAFSGNIERLKMCGDCRVKDMFQDILNDPESQLR